jgi:hypothetical protein
VSRGGYATSTLGKDLRQLDSLGLPPTGTTSSDVQGWLELYMARFRSAIPGLRTDLADMPQDWTGLAPDAPWADEDDPTEWDDDIAEDVTSNEFQDLLDEVVNALEAEGVEVAPAEPPGAQSL